MIFHAMTPPQASVLKELGIERKKKKVRKNENRRPSGEVVFGPGRPSMFGEDTKQIGFREPLTKINMISLRAKNLGLRRSDYLRSLVDEDLLKAGMI